MAEGLLPPIILELKARAGGVYSELGKVRNATRDMASDVEQHSTRAGKAFDQMGAAGKALSFGLAGTAIAVAGASLGMATDVQTGLTALQTGAGETEANIKGVADGILSLAGKVGVSANDLTKAMYPIESAGFHGADGMKVLTAASEGAKVGMADISVVADGLTTVLNDYHVPADKAADITSKLVAAVASGKTTMGDLAGALSNVAPKAAAAGISLEQTLGAMSTMTAQGISADQASQDLASAISSLQNPTAEQTKAMAQMGLSSIDVAQNLGKNGLTGTLDTLTSAITAHMGPAGTVLESSFNQSKLAAQSAETMLKQLPQPLQDIAQKFLDGTVTQKEWRAALQGQPAMVSSLGKQFATTATEAHGFSDTIKAGGGDAKTFSAMLAQMTGGSTGLSAALALTGGNLATFKSNVTTVSKATADGKGQVQGFAQVQKDLSFKLDQAKASVEATGVRIGMKLIPAVENAISVGATWGNWLTQHTGVLYTLAGVVGGVVTVAISAYVAHLAVAAAQSLASFGKMVAAGWEWVSTSAAQFGGWVAAQTASMAESMALWGMYASEWIARQAATLAANTAAMATSMVEWVATQAAGLASAIAGGVAWAVEHAALAASYIAENVAMAASATAAFIAENAATLGIGAAIALLVGAIIYLATHWKQVWGVVKQVAADVWNFLKPIFDFIVKWGLLPIRVEIDVLMAVWRAAWSGIKTAVETVWNWLKPVFDWIVGKLIGGIKAEIAGMEAVWSATWSAVQDAASTVWDWLKSAWDWLSATFMDGIKVDIAVVETVWSSVWSGIQSATSAVVDFFKDAWNWISSNLFDGLKAGVQTLEGVWSTVWGNIKAAVNDAWSVVQSVVNAIEGAISRVSSVVSGAGSAVQGVAHLLGFDDGGWVPGPDGQAQPAIVHSGEYVLSRDMLAGRAPVDPKAAAAIAANTPTTNPNAPAPASMSGAAPAAATAVGHGGTTVHGGINVNVQTNASPNRIARSIGWELAALT